MSLVLRVRQSASESSRSKEASEASTMLSSLHSSLSLSLSRPRRLLPDLLRPVCRGLQGPAHTQARQRHVSGALKLQLERPPRAYLSLLSLLTYIPLWLALARHGRRAASAHMTTQRMISWVPPGDRFSVELVALRLAPRLSSSMGASLGPERDASESARRRRRERPSPLRLSLPDARAPGARVGSCGL